MFTDESWITEDVLRPGLLDAARPLRAVGGGVSRTRHTHQLPNPAWQPRGPARQVRFDGLKTQLWPESEQQHQLWTGAAGYFTSLRRTWHHGWCTESGISAALSWRTCVQPHITCNWLVKRKGLEVYWQWGMTHTHTVWPVKPCTTLHVKLIKSFSIKSSRQECCIS